MVIIDLGTGELFVNGGMDSCFFFFFFFFFFFGGKEMLFVDH